MSRKIGLLFIALVLSVLLGACGEDDQKKANVSAEQKVDKLRIASWSQPITEQINLLAEEKTFFKEQNIEIEFIPGAGGGDAIKNIVSGKADIAFTDPGSLFAALEKGEKLKVLYDIYPQNVFNVVALKEKNITKPEDLKGKKIGVYSLSSGTRQNLLILLNQVGLTMKDVEIVETGVLNFAPLMQGQVDATAATDTGLATGESKGLGEVDVIKVKDVFNYSSDLYVVTEEAYEKNKEKYHAFLKGYRESAEWMMKNPEEAANLAVEYAIDGKDENHNFTIIKLRNASSLPSSSEVSEMGFIDLEKLQQAADRYYKLGLIDNKLDLSTVVLEEMVSGKLMGE
jgi:NitT/TauT family transport system substrate-binding protein